MLSGSRRSMSNPVSTLSPFSPPLSLRLDYLDHLDHLHLAATPSRSISISDFGTTKFRAHVEQQELSNPACRLLSYVVALSSTRNVPDPNVQSPYNYLGIPMHEKEHLSRSQISSPFKPTSKTTSDINTCSLTDDDASARDSDLAAPLPATSPSRNRPTNDALAVSEACFAQTSSIRHSLGSSGPWTRPARRHGRPAMLANRRKSTSTAIERPRSSRATLTSAFTYTAGETPPRQFRDLRKRKVESHKASDVAMEPSPFKKARIGSPPPKRLQILSTTSSPAAPSLNRDGPQSPLFFSNNTSRFTGRPTGPSSDASTSMLFRNPEDVASDVITVKLPYANVNSISSVISGSTATGDLGSSVDMSAPAFSPDTRIASPNVAQIQNIGAIELLEQDDRPTFLIDLLNATQPMSSGSCLHVLFCNASFRSSQDLMRLVGPEAGDCIDVGSYDHFISWATFVPTGRRTSMDSTSTACHAYAGFDWSCITVRQRFRFISVNSYRSQRPFTRSGSPLSLTGDDLPVNTTNSVILQSMPTTPAVDVEEPPFHSSEYLGDAVPSQQDEDVIMASLSDSRPDDPSVAAPLHHPDYFTNQVLQVQPVKQFFDWTRLPLDDSLPEHIKFAKTRDWASTPLGPMADWSTDLRTMSSLVMATPHPAAMYWGPECVAIYNEAYISLAGQKHPQLMGSRYKDAWAEIWDEIKPVVDNAMKSGESTMKHDNRLFLKRDGFLEETYFSWALMPLIGSDGEVVGLYNPCFENTRRKVNERRMHTLREIDEKVSAATTVTEFWPQLLAGLEYNEYDLPFSLIYSAKEDSESEVSSLHSGSLAPSSQFNLEGSLGIPAGHVAAPATLDFKTSVEGFAPYMRQSLSAGGAPVVLSEKAGTLPAHLLKDIDWRGCRCPCTTVVVFPVIPTTTKEAVAGFIVLGANPRRPYDDDYQLFVQLLSRQLATSLASVVLFEEEIRRGQRAARLAALDREELSMQLIERTQQATESEYRFTRMAEFAPVGMFIADACGTINYCNDMWWQISRHTRAQDAESDWMTSVREEDMPRLEAAWASLINEKVTISLEFRFKCSQQSNGTTIDTWVLMSAFPEKEPDGTLKSIFGCITDISSQKWAEKVQNERREEAVELKRQQENFIDITSHEMRNPLSAILQCADQIVGNISSFDSRGKGKDVEELLDRCLDAANTVNLCASHQKRIVNDILTLSKLDSHLLAVTPGDEQPVKVVQLALKMFEPELVAHDIEFECNVDDSFERHGISWVKMDPSRLSQVLINLMTNAIKFTQGRDRRKITVSLSASRDISEITQTGVLYFDTNESQRNASMDINDKNEWGTGELINIHCSVEDTGPGLAEEEMKLLFQRFQQATPRTHVQYGGSGLGLFISRILTEMQGGQIGVSSKRGIGSKFNFYIQCRRCVDPPSNSGNLSSVKLGGKNSSTTTIVGTADASNGVKSASSSRRTLFDVLIVEDNIVNQKVLQRQLQQSGNNTFVANHGFEALQTLQTSRFWAGQEQNGTDISVILMDLEMPVMDGITCARKIRELEREGTIVAHIPIIAVTAYARPEQIESAKAAGIVRFNSLSDLMIISLLIQAIQDDVISKPFRVTELLPKIEELVVKYDELSVVAKA
ncbi:hypothetical protein E4U21_003966 [Claviceps maximensis]|nr:hypothetical protein E4U21_003966 [Claviceps maximensis]